MATRARRVVVNAMLVAVALAAVSETLGAQGEMGSAVLDRERRSAQAEEARHARDEQYRRIEREQAHAQMPDTMYASTPDPSPPHPFLLDAGTESTPERSARVPARAEVRLGHRVGLFPAAARWTQEKGYQGFVRVINRSDDDGEVRIDAYDDEGTHRGPVTLTIGVGETKHFNSEDLEEGNAGKGLSEGVGGGEGDWRLEFTSTLDIEVLGYIRTGDGFLTSMHDVAPSSEAGHRVVTFNPGRNVNQASRLRVVNPGMESAEVRIEGTDDDGASSHGAVEFTLAAGASRTLSAKELESGEAQGVSGALGTGKGKWRLRVTAKQPIEVMSLLWSSTGHLTNLSTVLDNTESGEGGATATHAVALFPSASDRLGRQGFVRVINRGDQADEVQIDAYDDEGTHRGPVTLAIGAHETKHFNSDDLEGGNPEKGLDGSTGSGEGDWRLVLTSPLELQVLSYIRTGDGFLTSMHDVAPSTAAGHRVVTFNPGRNISQVSRLRVINPGVETAEVTIDGIDDKGASPGGAVVFSLAAEASRTLTAKELESGQAQGLSGALGTGKGKWRLTVTAEQPIEVMSLLSSPTGHLTNLSTVRGKVVVQGVEETAAEVFREHISGPIVQGKCIVCHVEGGESGNTRLVFVRESDPDHEARNLEEFESFLDEVDDGAGYILNKIQGVAHGGGTQVPAGSDDYKNMEQFLRLLGEDVTSAPLTPQTLFDTVTMAPVRSTLHRAALIFAGRIPTEEEYAAAERGGEVLRSTIRGLMTGPQFHEFLIRGANDRLLTDRWGEGIIDRTYFVDFTNERYSRSQAFASGDERAIRDFWDWYNRVQHGARRAPLELIAHVVENDLPYTEVLTADYIMANPWVAEAYGASTRFDDPEDAHEFKPSRIVSYYRHGEGFEVEDDLVLGSRVLDPGPLSTDYPHAGILNTTVFLQRYPTTATNRNRARSRWTYYHFLGLDIEKSASRTTDPESLADTNNPTMHNPACTVCHRVLDPVAGTFQNYGDVGMYKYQWGGIDSLDDLYKGEEGPSREIRATSWRNRETLSWPVFLPAGVQTLRVVFTNKFDDEAIGAAGRLFLDRLSVANEDGRRVLDREFEILEPPLAHWGRCGERHYNPDTGRQDHFILWGGYVECAFYVDVRVPSTGHYNVDIVAWSNGRYEQYGGDGFAMLAVAVNPYREGDTWYRDMRVPGFGGDLAPNSDNSVQWLAKQMVADERFAEAAVKFWWPAIMGSEVAEPPEDEADADFEGQLLAANAQGSEVTRVAKGFRRGFRGRAAYNLKDLLVEIVLSKWFRADAVEDEDPVRSVALRDAGARRLLTPEELSRKTGAVTGFEWGRTIERLGCWSRCERRPSALIDKYRLLYGGIDSDGITQRARDVTSVMAGVAKLHAVEVSCPVVMRELYLLPDAQRRLFAGIDQYVTPSRGADTIRNKLVELHDKLLDVQVTPHSPDVEAAYRLFADVVENGPRSQDDWFATYSGFAHWECDWASDVFFFEGLLDEAVVEYENEDGDRWYDFDWDRVDPFIDSVDWSDPHHAARAWVVVLAYMLMDYRYLNL